MNHIFYTGSLKLMAKREKPLWVKNFILRRKAKGWNAQKLAQEAKIPYPTLRDIEAAKSGGREGNKEAIAKALGCSMADLYLPTEFVKAVNVLKSPSKEYSALSPIPPELFEKYNTDLSHQLLTHYFLTGEDRYAEHLGNEVIEHLEEISRLLSLKRSPKPTGA